MCNESKPENEGVFAAHIPQPKFLKLADLEYPSYVYDSTHETVAVLCIAEYISGRNAEAVGQIT